MKPSLIFDLDGTLVDSLDGIAASLNRTLDLHGLPGHSHRRVRNFIGDGLRTLIQRAAPAGAQPELIDSLLVCYKPDYAQSWRTGTRLYPGIFQALAGFSATGYRLAVLSNKVHDFTTVIVNELLPSIHFDCVLGLRDGMPPKPDPAGALEIADRLDALPSSCILIGDSEMDVSTAANAGMKSIATTWGYQDRPRLATAGASCFIDSSDELVSYIRSLESSDLPV
ncbi:MAG: HAD family hydrolase [Verrucomicrobiota bacterium]